MKKIIFASALLILITSCNDKRELPKPFTKEILANQFFSINTSKDTLLETLHGSIIRISAGSFSVSGNIQIEIKEAFTPVEMLAAGLATESNGRPLKSAGMIYINASANGKAIELIKSVKVSIPTEYYEPEMKIFKGVDGDSGTVNWVDPVATDTTPQMKKLMVGKSLFQSKCASCHRIFSNGTGPALADVEYRGPWQDRNNILAYIKNPAAYTSNSKYAQNLISQYRSMMTAFPDINQNGLDAILDYIKNETIRTGAVQEEKLFYDSISKTPKINTDQINYNETDSIENTTLQLPCNDDTVYIELPKQDQNFMQNTSDTLPPNNNNQSSNPENLRNGFTDPNPTGGMYDFEIKTLGWYNIDAYMEGYAGTTNVKLVAEVRVDFEITMHVYLFCPQNKTLSVGYDKEGNNYLFNKLNDRIPLFMNDRAILFAFGSKDDRMFYGITEFRVQGEQKIIVNVKETTEEKIREALYSKEIDGIDLGIQKKEQKIIKNNCNNYSADTSKKINTTSAP